MVMSQPKVVELVRDRLIPTQRHEDQRLDVVDAWTRGNGQPLTLPRGATREHRALADITPTPVMPVVITTLSQAMHADGFRSPDARQDDAAWDTWQANDFETRQSAIHRAALSYGLAYVTVTPGVDSAGPRSVMRGVSPRKMIAVYEDPAEDDWPIFAMRVDISGRNRMLRVYDEDAVYFLGAGPDYQDVEFIEWRAHGSGVCPVVRYTNVLDLNGNAEGEVMPLIPLAARYNKTTYDRLLTQHFNSWGVRTVTGLEKPAEVTEGEADAAKLQLRQDDLLVAEHPDVKFGQLDGTPLSGFLEAANADLDTLSAVAQIPSTAFNKVANLSAEAIGELRAGLTQKVFERQQSFGKSHAQALRLAHRQETGGEVSMAARMTWRDMSPRTINQVVDGLAKSVTELGVPAQATWPLIPGVSKADIDDWKAMANTQAGREALTALAAAARVARQDLADDNQRRGDSPAG